MGGQYPRVGTGMFAAAQVLAWAKLQSGKGVSRHLIEQSYTVGKENSTPVNLYYESNSELVNFLA